MPTEAAILYISNNCRSTDLIVWHGHNIQEFPEHAATDIEEQELAAPHAEGLWIWEGECIADADSEPIPGDFRGNFRKLTAAELAHFVDGCWTFET